MMVGSGILSNTNGLAMGRPMGYNQSYSRSNSSNGPAPSIPLHGMATLEQIQTARAIMQSLGSGSGSNSANSSARPSPSYHANNTTNPSSSSF